MVEEDGDHTIKVDWMTGKPAPETVIEFLACDRRTACKKNEMHTNVSTQSL
jgi:hypothetical protein